jgi:hypothetical protein
MKQLPTRRSTWTRWQSRLCLKTRLTLVAETMTGAATVVVVAERTREVSAVQSRYQRSSTRRKSGVGLLQPQTWNCLGMRPLQSLPWGLRRTKARRTPLCMRSARKPRPRTQNTLQRR